MLVSSQMSLTSAVKGLAFTSDGVGTKALIAQMMNRYDTIGIDCVAMNVNDLLCVGATPLSMVDYIAVRNADPYLLDEISKGLAAGACAARISIPGGEIAQLPDIIADHHGGHAFDLAGSAVGLVDLDKILIGQDIRDGDVVVGIESNGVHSNGVTLARRVLFEQAQYNVHTVLPGLQTSIGEELLRPTHIYVSEALQILEKIPVKALVHITSDGFLNLARVHAPVGFVIEELPPIPPIFAAIQQAGSVPDEEMFRVFNMGVGFCVVVAGEYVEQVISLVHSHGKKAQRIGYAVQDEQRHVVIAAGGTHRQRQDFR